MRINIAASHRFHLLDLARELSSHGHDVRFYSYVPTKRAVSFGLKKECSYSLFYLLIPFILLKKITNESPWSVKLCNSVLDSYLAVFMKPCDIYIALGTVYLNSLIKARSRFGSKVILEWGSKHILDQQRILSEIPGLIPQKKYFIDRALKGYELSDYIAVSSDHVKSSFIKHGVASNKLIQNPYGVDLSMFGPTSLAYENYDVVMVGGWSYRKGCDLLSEFFIKSSLTFLHVGPLVDLPFPSVPNMVHVEPVDQKMLKEFYSKAKIFVLASREEGLAMVQSQALVCGLPIVCTKDSGGRDLRAYLSQKEWIIEINEFNVNGLSDAIYRSLELAKSQVGFRSYSRDVDQQLSWKSYGDRYDSHLLNIFENG